MPCRPQHSEARLVVPTFLINKSLFFGGLHSPFGFVVLKLNSTKLPYFHGILALETQDVVLCGQEEGRLRMLWHFVSFIYFFHF